jgi:hypothetical protein
MTSFPGAARLITACHPRDGRGVATHSFIDLATVFKTRCEYLRTALSCAVRRSRAAAPWPPARRAAFVHSGQTVPARPCKLDGGIRAADGLENSGQVDNVTKRQ